MGPRPFGRGRLGMRQNRMNAVHGFNGAATFRPRKARFGGRATITCLGFNGAATFRPRKAVDGQ